MKPLLDLNPRDCRYPFGDHDILFCGRPTCLNREGEESSYCWEHYLICTRETPARKIAA